MNNKIKKLLVSLLLVVTNLAYALPTAKITLKVVDETGKSIPA